MTRAWDKGKIRWVPSPTEIEPMTSRTPGGRSIHWATRTHGEQGHLTEFINAVGDSDFPLSHARVMLINSPFTFHHRALKIHHLYSLITTHDDFGSANPSSIQDACHI